MKAALKLVKTDKPYALGHNGHARKCDCDSCVKARARELAARIGMYGGAKVVGVESDEATIFVRAHMRRGRHYTRMPNTKRYVRKLLGSMAGAIR